MRLAIGSVSVAILLVISLNETRHGGARAAPAPQDSGQETVRFAVAHEHTGSWCVGWLNVSSEYIEYVVEQPPGGAHSFRIKRSEVLSLTKWTVRGQSTNALEMQTAHQTYHFWWLANERDLQTGKPYQWNPPDAAPPDPILRIIQDPSTASQPQAQDISGRAQSIPETKSNPPLGLKTASSDEGQLATANDAKIPAYSKVYVAPMSDGFENYIIAGLRSKKVPLTVVIDRSRADYEISGVSESEKAGWAKMLFKGSDNSAEQASIKVADLKTGAVIFGYSVHKGNSARGRQSAGEACAKHLKEIVSE